MESIKYKVGKSHHGIINPDNINKLLLILQKDVKYNMA